MNNTGVAAKHRGIRVHLIGVEGDEKHLDFARETFEINRISSSEYLLMRGVAAARSGIALFPRQEIGEETWGSEPIFDVSEAEAKAAVATGRFDSLRMIPLIEVIADRQKVDLLHMDIQGGEANLIADTIDLLTDRVAYLVVGTHSRAIEGRLFEVLLDAGWQLEIERPAIFGLVDGRPQTTVDGVQGWRNPSVLGRSTLGDAYGIDAKA